MDHSVRIKSEEEVNVDFVRLKLLIGCCPANKRSGCQCVSIFMLLCYLLDNKSS